MAKLVDKFYKDAHANVFNFSYSVLTILLLITVGITYVFYKSAHTRDVTRFQTEAERIQSAVKNRIKIYIGLLNSGKGFIESTTDLNNDKFLAYTKSLNLQTNYSGLRALGFVKSVGPDDVDALTDKMRLEVKPEFGIFPESGQSLRQVLIFVEPLNDLNRQAIGFDMTTEPVRREALERAGDTGKAAASGRVIPVINPAETGTDPRIIIFLPVYGSSVIAGTFPHGPHNIQGYIYGGFIAENFLTEINQEVGNKDISVKIYDEEAGDDHLLAKTGEQPPNGFIILPSEVHSKTAMVEIAGKNWLMEYSSLPSFNSQSSLGVTPLIFFAGICVSFVLFGMTYWEASARVKLQRTAGELFETQKQKEKLFEDEQKSRLAAEHASLAKDEFIAVVSHELKTPLNAIAGWTRILRTHDISDTTRETALVKIEKNLRAQAGLVEQLLTYSDIISENIDIENNFVNFAQLVEETIAGVEPQAKDKGIELVTRNDLNGELVGGDDERLKLVLECILTNAVKFTQSGGKIEADLTKNGDLIRFTVKDNGRGIPAEFMPFIFDQYTQADRPNTRDYGGLGLGLTISKHIVKLHDGTIEAESEGKGKGSKFIIQLPEKKD